GWFFSISAAMAVFITAGIGLVQLPGAIAAGLGKVGDKIKESGEEIGDRIAIGLRAAGNSAVTIWKRASEAAEPFFVQVAHGIKLLAGFFWNFGQNVGIIFDFMEEHWFEVWKEIGRGTGVAIVNIIENIIRLGAVIRTILSES